ncbi:MAG: RlmE family RNA methyltransferase [Candidatus Peregrinibacteria bacterium]
MQYNPKDTYFEKAKREGYRARSIYKLEAIQQAFHILKKGDRVLDLGAAPGSFLQYISRLIGSKGRVVGVDLKEIKPFKAKNIFTVVADVLDEEDLGKKLAKEGAECFNVIVSDMAPNTSGIPFLDGGRSQTLNEQVLKIAEKYLAPDGHMVLKLLPGVNEGELIRPMKQSFKEVRHFRPQATRRTSGEFYLVGLHRK